LPLIPDDVNEIFDAIINGKHGEIERTYHGGAFASMNGGAGSSGMNTGTDEIGPDAAGDIFACPLDDIPVGDRITSVTFAYRRGAGGNVSYRLERKPLAGGAVEAITALTTDSTTVGVANVVVAAIDHVVATGYAYALRLGFDVAAVSAGATLIGGAAKHDKL
jgi:hypothetical protein